LTLPLPRRRLLLIARLPLCCIALRLQRMAEGEVMPVVVSNLTPCFYKCKQIRRIRNAGPILGNTIPNERPLARENVLDEMLHNLVPSTPQICFVR
jgi:hypothetical protein